MPREMARPRPDPPVSAAAGFLAAIEALEDFGQVFGADAFASIAHGHFHAALGPPRRDA